MYIYDNNTKLGLEFSKLQDILHCFRDCRTAPHFPGQSCNFRDGWQVCRRLKSSPLPHDRLCWSLSLQRRQTDRLYCRSLPLEAASLFAVNLCGRSRFAIDLLAHLGFKRMVSCSFRDKRMRLKTRAYGIYAPAKGKNL